MAAAVTTRVGTGFESSSLSSSPPPRFPLTTIWTLPPDCEPTWDWLLWTTTTGTPVALPYGVSNASSCYLPFAVQMLVQGVPAYSPGICPSGYTAASTFQPGAYDLAQTSICCDSGYEYQIDGLLSNSCISYVPTPTTILTLTETSMEASVFSYTRRPTKVQGFLAVRTACMVAWASKDLTLFTPKSAPLILASQALVQSHLAAQSATSSSTHNQSATDAASPASSPSNSFASPTAQATDSANNLTTGTQAGIGVGVALAGIALGMVAIWLVLIRPRRRRTNGKRISDIFNHGLGLKAELDTHRTRTEQLHETSSNKTTELSAEGLPREADTITRHELEAGYKGIELGDAASSNSRHNYDDS